MWVWGRSQVPRVRLFLLSGCIPCLENPIFPLLLFYKKGDFSWWSSISMQKLGSSRLLSHLLKLGTWIFKSQENSVCFFEQLVDVFPSELTATVPSSQPAALVSSLPVIHWPLKTQNGVLLQKCESRAVCPACSSPPLGLQGLSLCIAQNAWLQSSWHV